MSRPVLVVEDNPLVLEIYRSSLAPLGVTLIEALTGEAAVAALERETPRLIVMDIVLPGMSGYDLIGLLRSQPRTKRVPVIAVSNAATQADARRLQLAGFDAVVPKPFAIDFFVATVSRFLNQRGNG